MKKSPSLTLSQKGKPVPRPGPRHASRATAHARLARYGIHVLVAAYVLANLPILATKATTFDEARVFSFDEHNLCRQVDYLLQTRSLISLPSTPSFFSCNPFPYGQLYLLLIAAPLLILQAFITIPQTLVIHWAALLLVLSGAAVLILLYKICCRLYPPAYGVLAALLLAVTPEFLRWSNEIHPDLPQLALLLASFYFAVRLYERSETLERGDLRDLSLAALFAGAAMATKFNGGFLLPVILLAYNRPFALGFKHAGVGRFITHNVRGAVVMGALFTATFFVLNPCFVAHPQLLAQRFSAIAATTTGRVADIGSVTGGAQPVSRSFTQVLSNIAYSNATLAQSVLGYGMYVCCCAGLLLGLGRLVTRYAEEIRRPAFLADLFNVGFLTYALVLGYQLINGRLLPGYARYILPAVPTLFVSALRALHAILSWNRLPTRVTAGLGAALLVVGQANMIHGVGEEYVSRYFQKEKGFFKVRSWVREHIPPGSTIYTEAYVLMPDDGYRIVRDYAVQSLGIMAASDYVITKTLRYSVYRDPVTWELYKIDRPQVVAARKIYELLESNSLPMFHKVTELSAGDHFEYDDAVVVYKNLNPPAGR